MGMSGIAITDHECLSAHMEVNQYSKEIKEKYPDFKIALGNEIYLTEDRSLGQKYYHFILIAKDKTGHKALRELSSEAWLNSYVDRGMERVPTLKEDLFNIMSKYRGHVIATTACLGGELSTHALAMSNAENVQDIETAKYHYDIIIKFIEYCLDIFGEDFYIECAPGSSKDQVDANKKLLKIAKAYNIKMVVGTDAHYLVKEDRFIHKAYLNSKGGEREVDSFYEFSRLMEYEEVIELLTLSMSEDEAIQICKNTLDIQNKIEDYSLEHTQIIPKVEVKDYPKTSLNSKFEIIEGLLNSEEIQERYWINECLLMLKEKDLFNDEYLERIEIEADIIKYIGEKLNDCLFAYFNTFKHYIDLFWKCGSIVGPGRGSATGFLSNYLLGITQLDPIRWGLPHWRFLSKGRINLPDIDIDLAPSKRPAIFKAIREERGDLGLVQVATFGTEGTKSAILTACRGYCNEEYPDGIDVDQAQYMSSLIPQERGFLWELSDVVYGNPDKDRKPVHVFNREVNKYPGLLQIIERIVGIINKRSSHASGVILYDKDPYATASFMRTPGGDVITCYDLGDAESAGDTKYDFLVTEISDKIIKCFDLLKEDNVIEDLNLRDLYNKYIHPEIIDTTDSRIWNHLAAGDIMDVFQFCTGVGLAIAKKLRPQNPMEMTSANAMMRLMSEKGKESQQDRYIRIKNSGLDIFDNEMSVAGFSEDQKSIMHKHCDQFYGCCAIQEQMMELLMEMADFSLEDADYARKVVAKKKMKEIPNLRKMVFENFTDSKVADYFWENVIAPQLGYAFSKNHSLPYSFVGIQSIFLSTNFNSIYWNTACLIVNSGGLDQEAEIENGIDLEDLEEEHDSKKKTVATDYGKVAKAIGDIRAAGINVSLADINNSKFGFAPDVKNNKILFGLKGMLNVSDDIIHEIIKNRPYVSIKDFYNRVKPKKQTMISLIKGGAFDELEDRKFAMAWYIWETCSKKNRITLQNMPGLIKYDLLPKDTEEQILAGRIYEFNRYLKSVCKCDAQKYKLDIRALNFIGELDLDNLLIAENEDIYLNIKSWDKVYQDWMNVFRNWINENKENILTALNTEIFKEDWDKYAKGTISAWEMEVLCFYYHEHELANINRYKYGFSDFSSMPEEPVIDRVIERGGKEIKLYKLYKICGTCIAKNKTKGTVALLTTDGVVNVKFRKEYFSLFDKQISERQPDGTKKVVEKSWFNRGSMIIVMGIRSGDDFISKKYTSSSSHQLYKILDIDKDGDLILQDSRYQGDVDENI